MFGLFLVFLENRTILLLYYIIKFMKLNSSKVESGGL